MKQKFLKIILYLTGFVLAIIVINYNQHLRQNYSIDPDHYCAADSDIYRYECQPHKLVAFIQSIPVPSQNQYYLLTENALILLAFLIPTHLIQKKLTNN
jgi:hypothetical protein